MKKSGQSKMKVQLYEGLLVVVIIVVIVVLILAVRSDKKNIEKTFDNTLTYLKSQCLSYDEVVQADKIKSLVRLTEQAVEVGTDIHRDSELIDSVYLKNYIEAQRMAGIIILDEDMQPECQYSNVGLDYDAWKELIRDKKISEITKYSKKIYAERIQKNDKWYDLAAISRTDSPGVVFCYCYQDTDRLTDSYAAVNNLLAGYAMDMNGTLFIAADDKIYGTNDAQYENCQTTEIPVIQELRSTELSDNLVYFTSDGHRYCGGKGRYRDYNLYVYYPQKEVFAATRRTVLLALCISMLIWAAATVARNKSGRVHMRELNEQLKIIEAQQKKEVEYQLKLKQSMEEAVRANIAKTDFLRRMSHDIRTPMNAIMGMATIAKAHVDERERILDCMEKINGASKLLLSLINEVLDMSKIESGRLILSEDEFNVGELLQDLVVMMQPEIKNKQQTLNIHVKNLRHENVKGDTQRIKQVLMNILSNAIKYTPENGRITIEIYEKDPHNGIGNYQFVFEDNGRGMKPEFLDKIFEPFERASDDEIKRIQGTGLGMSISHKIIQMMGGDIKVESEYGKGSRFTIDMPLVCRDQKPDDKIEVEGLEVLVVDDDKIACLNTSSCLREIGINSECVYSGSEAIEKVRQHHLAEKEYFAVIIDLKMPQMNGIETTRQIRRFVGADVPIIILSAYDLEEYEAEAKEVKANGFITKPLYKSKLLQVLRSFLDEGDQPEPIRPFKLSNVDYSGKRILLVEDNELNREIAVEIIGSTGITIDTAINGLDAVHKVAQSEEGFYQIILMDIQMPIMDGYEATRQIRSLQRRDIAHMPIIAMTANAFSEDVTNAIKAGMNYHLAKPIDIGALMGILSKYLQAPA